MHVYATWLACMRVLLRLARRFSAATKAPPAALFVQLHIHHTSGRRYSLSKQEHGGTHTCVHIYVDNNHQSATLHVPHLRVTCEPPGFASAPKALKAGQHEPGLLQRPQAYPLQQAAHLCWACPARPSAEKSSTQAG